MAIKIECSACGFRNDLGRVFCTQCGVKLDLKRTAPSDLNERREVRFGAMIGKMIGGLLTLGILGGLGLGFWPVKLPVVQRDASGGQQVVLKTRAVKKAIMAKQKASVDFTETEINGFLGGRAESRRFRALTVDIRSGAMDVGAWFTWRPGIVTNLTWLPAGMGTVPVSLEMTVVFDNGQMRVTGGRVGHLPLVGPMQGIPQAFFKDVFSDVVAEKQVVDALAEVVLDQDVAHVKFGE
jgi:hypothetical protein